MSIKNINENEVERLKKFFETNKTIKDHEYELASLYNYYSKQIPKYSKQLFAKELSISPYKISHKLKLKNIVFNKDKNLYEISDQIDRNKLYETSFQSHFKYKNLFEEFERGDNEVKRIKNDIEKLKKDIILLKENKNLSNCNKTKKKIRYQDYLNIETKPIVRSFEVYDLVINYFIFIAKTFDNRLLREIHNELLIEYGENLMPNSFATYCKFLKEESENDLNVLKQKMIKEKSDDKYHTE